MNKDGIIYTLSGDHYIVGTDSKDSNNNAIENGKTLIDVVIPRYIGNIIISRIGNGAFKYNPSIQSIIISKTIKEIGFDAIAYIGTLKKIFIEENSQLEKIEQGFGYYIGITSFICPPSVKSIGPHFLVELGFKIYITVATLMTHKPFLGMM